jgi:hypothetical protein
MVTAPTALIAAQKEPARILADPFACRLVHGRRPEPKRGDRDEVTVLRAPAGPTESKGTVAVHTERLAVGHCALSEGAAPPEQLGHGHGLGTVAVRANHPIALVLNGPGVEWCPWSEFGHPIHDAANHATTNNDHEGVLVDGIAGQVLAAHVGIRKVAAVLALPFGPGSLGSAELLDRFAGGTVIEPVEELRCLRPRAAREKRTCGKQNRRVASAVPTGVHRILAHERDGTMLVDSTDARLVALGPAFGESPSVWFGCAGANLVRGRLACYEMKHAS